MEKNIVDESGFNDHCTIAELLFKHRTKQNKAAVNHHIRGAIRQASNKVHNGTTKQASKRDAHFFSEGAINRIIENGNSFDCGGLETDHVVPISVIQGMIEALELKTSAEIGGLVKEWTYLALITNEEHNTLNANEMNQRMPEGWKIGDDIRARYVSAGIELIESSKPELLKE